MLQIFRAFLLIRFMFTKSKSKPNTQSMLQFIKFYRICVCLYVKCIFLLINRKKTFVVHYFIQQAAVAAAKRVYFYRCCIEFYVCLFVFLNSGVCVWGSKFWLTFIKIAISWIIFEQKTLFCCALQFQFSFIPFK